MKKQFMLLPLVLVLCFAFSCKQGEEVPVEKEEQPSVIVDNAISADGVSIAYEVRGEGEPNLVFVHGWSSKRSLWDIQLAHFSQNYRVVAIDLPGFGDSGNDRETWTMEIFGEDIVAVLNKLKLKNVILIGLSMGGPVVVETAKYVPEQIKGIVLVDVMKNIETVTSQESINNIYETYMDMVTYPTLDKIRPFFIANKEELSNRYIQMVENVSKVGWGESLKDYFRWSNETCIPSIQQIKVPIRSINADHTPTNIETFKKYVPSFEAKIIIGIGHIVPWEAPDDFNRLLEETIQEFAQTAEQE
jgi:pimeloyl-ACP methyl ester carboxylesterase